MAAVVAVVGGGQLARMMQQAAIGLDVHLRVLVEAADGATGQVVPDAPVGRADDAGAVRGILPGARVLTFEHEHVPGELLRQLESEGVAVRPGSQALRHAQDKIVMRTALSELGVPCPRWAAVRTREELATFGDATGWPVVVKTARGGYDGKGVRVVAAADDAGDWLDALTGEDALLAEERVPFTRELAVLVARRPSGEMRAWPVVETVQRDGVCAEVLAPAPDLDPDLAAAAVDVATRIAEGLDVTGVLAVEMFEYPSDDDGGPRIALNELAMRPHNSGHWTIDGAVTSQFEQHLRAVLDLPLGPTDPRAPVSVMVNLLGSRLPDPSAALGEVLARCPGARVELYGKEVRPGRKLGHVTVYGEDLESVRAEARTAVALLRGEDEHAG
ncbi:5-(carboxyamino)imidazole ribonucleotide synthase [Georgenia satyanarayanai]|uniref:N5-carboxyaminoimidazole ribonucleotide synthase n=1 Tax=Georgenia satyanarayanai TaxID=860221 RepID=A0A2Y9AS93_9MICO|nr:5-(carboxyamino)imidazole ribonucleotide synthase [Georgenia satyanarayanai]PYF95921.1 5-(carboxyamino)imidazole ribonucleotide synthase [Georgenia satyanarayanai]SSA47290.1 5-(carboxyamino)imidazole ribonucleotide synthase [Georgenia satyanarayanai]